MKKIIRTDLSSFETLRNIKDSLYVDKTRFIYKLVNDRSTSSYYFVSRPRRYGKSLMCSTLKCLFEGKRDLFKGLYIDDTDYSFEKYPVISLNLAELNTTSYDTFIYDFQLNLARQARFNGIEVGAAEPSTMLSEILDRLEKKAVIIVDEFDYPVLKALDDKDMLERIRSSCNSFYSVIKNRNEDVRFFFITGVTKLSNLSIFSAMNNLTDISMLPGYSDMYGYTESELEENFSEYIDEYMEKDEREYKTRDEFISAIRGYYNGYRFSADIGTKVYNPVSVGFFFTNGCLFKNYWQSTGVSSLAITLAREFDLLSIVKDEAEISMSDLSSFDISCLAEHSLRKGQVLALLYYSGYLTIVDGDADAISVAFPNREISTTFTQDLMLRYTDNEIELPLFSSRAMKAIRKNDTAALVDVLMTYYAQFPYTLLEKDKKTKEVSERSFQLAFFAFFVSMGGKPIAEEATMRGRSDVVFSYGKHTYIVELKVDRNAEEAVSQIKEMGYQERYLSTGRVLHLLRISFSSKERKIESWKEEIIGAK